MWAGPRVASAAVMRQSVVARELCGVDNGSVVERNGEWQRCHCRPAVAAVGSV